MPLSFLERVRAALSNLGSVSRYQADDRSAAYHELKPPTPGTDLALAGPDESQAAASARPAPRGPMLQLKGGSTVLVADLAPTKGLSYALMNLVSSRLCKKAPCPHGAECMFLHLKEQPGAAAAASAQLGEGSPTKGLSSARVSPGKSQMCMDAQCHVRESTFLHSKEQSAPAAAASAMNAPGVPLLLLKDGSSVLVANVVPTKGLAFALMNPGKAQVCWYAPCHHGRGCNFLHLKEPPLPGDAIVQLKDGTSVPLAHLAPTVGIAFALMSPGKSQMCGNSPCPHGAECIFLHLNAQPGSAAAANAKTAHGPAMLQLANGTSFPIANLALTEGLALALADPGKSQLCRSAPCHRGVTCPFLHPKSMSARTCCARGHIDPMDLENVHRTLWKLRREILRQLNDNPSETLGTELRRIDCDAAQQLRLMDRQLEGTPLGRALARAGQKAERVVARAEEKTERVQARAEEKKER